ncbi:MAG: response regulator transcription factor, partial [Anaerolineae bacterium]|nr:response regulator transcription factor [Anaerolineae bacterium]
RAGFRSLLTEIPGVEVIAEAGDGREALRLAKEHQPDVVLMDISMPGLNGLDATMHIARECPDAHVIILSVHASEEYVIQALQAGASGYLLKKADAAELEIAVRSVSQGETYLSPPVSKQIIADYLRRIGQDTSPLERLTPRQREVLQLIAEGHTSREVARILGISVKTVETHRATLMERLDIHDVASLVRYAIRVGMISPEH